MSEPKLSEDFKKSFGKLIVLLKCQGTTEAKVRYSSTLLEVVESGLLTLGKSGQYRRERIAARTIFYDMVEKMQRQGRPLFVDAYITRSSANIGILLMPIITREELALIDDSCFSTADRPEPPAKESVF